MKLRIKTSFSCKTQAIQFHPVEANEGIEIEVEVDSPEEAEKEYDKWQKFVRERAIKSTIEGTREFLTKRALLIEDLELNPED